MSLSRRAYHFWDIHYSAIYKMRDIEIRVRGHLSSLKMEPFESLGRSTLGPWAGACCQRGTRRRRWRHDADMSPAGSTPRHRCHSSPNLYDISSHCIRPLYGSVEYYYVATARPNEQREIYGCGRWKQLKASRPATAPSAVSASCDWSRNEFEQN